MTRIRQIDETTQRLLPLSTPCTIAYPTKSKFRLVHLLASKQQSLQLLRRQRALSPLWAAAYSRLRWRSASWSLLPYSFSTISLSCRLHLEPLHNRGSFRFRLSHLQLILHR